MFRNVILGLMPVNAIVGHFNTTMGRPTKKFYSIAMPLIKEFKNITVEACPHQPLSAKAIIKFATQDGLWKPIAGKTPANTLHASINKEIKAKGEASRFSRSSEVRGAFLLAAKEL